MSKKYTTNFLEDTNGSTGSANQVLISTPSGIDWVDGSGSSIIGGPYLPLAGGTMTGHLKLNDNVQLQVGSSTDLQILHDASDSFLINNTGDLYLRNLADDKDIIFSSDNGFGATTPYFQLDGSHTQSIAWKDIHFVDGIKAKFGDYASPDLQIYHDGSNSYIHDSGIGDLYIQGSDDIYITAANGEKFITCNTDGSVEIRYDNVKKFETTSTGVTVTGTATATTFSGDLNGTINTATTAVTKPNATNDTTVATTAFVQNLIGTIPAGLVFQGTWNASTNTPTLSSGSGTTGHFYIVSTDGSTNLDGITDWKVGDWAVFVEQGATDAWEKVDNSSVLDGAGTGQTVAMWSGSGTSNTLTNAPITFSGNDATFTGNIHLDNDSSQLQFGDDNDMQIYHNGANGKINNTLGNFNIDSAGDITLDADGGDIRLYDGGVLYGNLANGAGNFQIKNPTQDMNISFIGNDGGSNVTALTLDMSEGGNATFAGDVGIGVSPSQPLDVNGTALIRNTIYVGDDIQHWGDGGTGMFFGTDTISLKNDGGSTRLFVKSGGNVGIGTTSPNYKLAVYGSSTDSEIVASFGSANDVNEYTAIGLSGFIASNGATKAGLALKRTSTYGTGELHFLNNNTLDNSDMNLSDSKMMINSSGNVGIGTTSPLTKLEVYDGDIKLNDSTRNLLIGEEGSSSYQIKSSGYLIIDATSGIQINKTTSGNVTIGSGNVGIGTTSPNNFGFLEKVLNISAGSSSSTTLQQAGIVISGSSDADDADDFGYLSFTNYQSAITNDRVAEIRALKNGTNVDTGEFAFYTSSGSGPAERMRIDSSGNVGIGTSSPEAKLDVEAGGTGDAQGDTTTAAIFRAGRQNVWFQNRRFGAGTDWNNNTFKIIAKIDNTSHQSINFVNDASYQEHIDIYTGNQVFNTRFNANGNVGIGTTSPGAKLEISHSGTNNGLLLENTLNSSNYQIALNIRENEGLIFQRWIAGAFNGNLMRIGYTGAIKFDAYDSTNNTGTPTYLLGTDASGNVVKTNTVPGSAAGPYLPLAGGTMTGDLLMDGKAGVGNVIGLATGTSSNAMSLKLYTYNNIDPGGGLGTSTGNMIQADLGSNLVLRQTANNGDITFQSDDGAGGIATYLTLDGSSTDAYFSNPGNVGIGTTNPQSKLQINDGSVNITKAMQSGGVDHDFLQLSYAGSWGNNVGGLASINFTDNLSSSNTVGRIGVTYTGSQGKFVVTDLYSGGYGASGDVFTIQANGQTYIKGNVGIGTTSPSAKLHLEGDAIIEGVLRADNFNLGLGGAIKLKASNSLTDQYVAFGTTPSGSNGNATFTEKMRIDSDGNVGIGTTSPTANLYVSGSNADATDKPTMISESVFTVKPVALNSGNLNFAQVDSGNSIGMQYTNGSGTANWDISMQPFGGNVGIGTTSPDSLLHIKGADPVFIIQDTSTGTVNASSTLRLGESGSGGVLDVYWDIKQAADNLNTHLEINHSSNGNHFTILDNGNVGIGTTSPGDKLEVSGNVYAHAFNSTGTLSRYNGSGGIAISGLAGNAYAFISAYSNSGGAGKNLSLQKDGGNVGIGTTSPAVQLELGDNTADEKLRLTGAASGKPLMTFYNTTTKIGQIASSSVGVTVTSLGSGNMSFENGGNNRLVIDNSGNVGIADTSPSYKLDVDGTIRATGDVIAYSDIRVKENIKTIDNAVSKVNKLRGVEFNKIGSEEKSIGVIAQEIEKVLPEVVKEDDKGMKSVAYGNIVGVLIEAIKDQQKQIDELKSIINGSTK